MFREQEAWFNTFVDVDVASFSELTLSSDVTLRTEVVDPPAEGTDEAWLASGNFTIGRRLGRGGQGTVFLATDHRSDSQVALKVLHRRDALSLTALKREFRSLADLIHPNIVRLHELVASETGAYVSMEYVPGQPLLVHLEASLGKPTRNVAELRLLFAQLALALQATHLAGLVHGDVSARNVHVTPDGHVVLLDFGLARRARHHHTKPRRVCGTPGYMAPEQATGEAATAASDWYAFGTLLYRALTGWLPFQSTSRFHLHAKLNRSPKRAAERSTNVPADLDQLCADLLTPRREDRPAGSEILARLGAVSLPKTTSAFVGRAEEIAALTAAHEHACARETAYVCIFGASGVGKTALVQHFLAGANSRLRLLAGRCYERALVPFRTLDELVDRAAELLRGDSDLRGALGQHEGFQALCQLFPILDSNAARSTTTDPHRVRELAILGFRKLMATLAQGRSSVVLWLDDVQWSDRDSVPLIIGLLADPLPGLMLIATCRSPAADARDGSHLVNAIDRLDQHDRRRDLTVTLGRLSLDETHALAGSMRERLSPDDAFILHERSEGYPLLLKELLRHSQLRSLLHRDPGRGAAARIPYEQQFLGRLAHLEASSRQMLERVAVANRPLPKHVVHHDISAAAAAELEELAFVLCDGEQRWRCAHDRDRELITASLNPGASMRRHGELAARYLEVAPSDHEALAYHFEEAGDEARSTSHMIAAARCAWDTFAFDRVSELLSTAITRLRDPDDALRIESMLAESHVRTGRLMEAAVHFESCARKAPPKERGDLLRRAVEQRLTAGDFTGALAPLRSVLRESSLPCLNSQAEIAMVTLVEGARALRRALARRRPAPPIVADSDKKRLRVCLTALRGFTTYDTFRGTAFTFIYLRLAVDVGDPSHIALANAYGAVILSLLGTRMTDYLQRRLLTNARSAAASANETDLIAAVEMSIGEQQVFAGHWQAGAAHIQRFLPDVERQGRYGPERDTAEQIRMIALQRSGELPTMQSEAQRRYASGHDNMLPAAIGKNAGWLAFAALARDDPPAARAYANESQQHLPTHAFLFAHWQAKRAYYLCDLYENRPRAALEQLERLWPVLEGSALLQLKFVRVSAAWLRATAAVGSARVEGTSTHLQFAREFVARFSQDRAAYARGPALLVKAAIEDLTGLSYASSLEDARQAFEAAGMRLDALTCRRMLHTSTDARSDLHEAFYGHGVVAPQRWVRLYGVGAETES